MDHFGYLSVQVLSAGGAIPVSQALIKIESADEYDRIEAQTSLTDMDGRSDVFALPAPPFIISLTPGNAEAPSALYQVTVYKEGYYPQSLNNISIFENIYSTLTIPLVPDALYNPQDNRPIIPNNESEDII